MEGKYLISILVPMYNTEKYIARCIESILNQTYKNIELVLVDDGSVDDTYKIASEYANKDNRIKLYKKENEKNVAKTRNFLLDKINGKFFTFVDSDDYLEKEFIETLYKYIHKEHADVAMCGYSIQILKHSILNKRKVKELVEEGTDSLDDIVYSHFPCHFMLWNKLYRTSILEDISFNENCRYGEDFSFVVYYYSRVKKSVTINKRLYHYMIRPGSEMRAKYSSKHLSFIKFLEDSANNSEDELVKETCKIWLPISAASVYFMAKRKHAKNNQDDLDYLRKMIVDYKEYVFNSKKVNKAYKAYLQLIIPLIKL